MNRWIIAISSFLLGSTLFAVIGVKNYYATGQTNLLLESFTSSQFLNIYQHAPEELEPLLIREIACGLRFSKEIQDTSWGFESEENTRLVKKITDIVESTKGSCPDI